MNNILLAGKVTEPWKRVERGDKPFWTAQIRIPPQGDGPVMQIPVKTWSEKTAIDAAVDSSVVVRGAIEIYKVPETKQQNLTIAVTECLPLAGFTPINAVCVVGRLGQEPDIKYFESGKVKAGHSLAVDGRGKNAPPTWLNIEWWDRTAQVVGEYANKGSLIAVSGSLKFEHWTDRNTAVPRSKPIILGRDLKLLGSKQDQDTGHQTQSREDVF